LFSTEFRKSALDILRYQPPEEDYFKCNLPPKLVRVWNNVTELALVVSPVPNTPKRFKSHTFNPEDVISLSNRMSKQTLEDNIQNILKCPKLRVLCIHGVGNLFEAQPLTMLCDKLSTACPLIEHFILDDSDIVLATSYTEKVEVNYLSCLEVKNNDRSTDDLIDIIDNSPHLKHVLLTDVSNGLLDSVVPNMTSLTLSWLTKDIFHHFTDVAKRSSIKELHLHTVDLKIDEEAILKLASSLPQLECLELSSPLKNIVHLVNFKNLTQVIWDADVILGAIDPYFPLDLKFAIGKLEDDCFEDSLSPKSPTDTHNVPAPTPIPVVETDQQANERLAKEENSTAFNSFLEQKGANLEKLYLTIRNRYKKDFLVMVRKCCPKIKHFKVVSVLDEHYFDSKHFNIPSLESLSLSGIIMTDRQLLDILDHCNHLKSIELDTAKKLTSNSILLLQSFADYFMKHSDDDGSLVTSATQEAETKSSTPRTRFVAKISTVGVPSMQIKFSSNLFTIDFERNLPVDLNLTKNI